MPPPALSRARALPALLAALSAGASSVSPWQDPTLPVAARVADLVGRLTLDEKAALLNFRAPAVARLGLPAFGFETECQRGIRAPSVPSVPFPSGAAQSATFNATLAFAIGAATATQARADFNLRRAAGDPTAGTTCYGPTINVVRDPRWGRVNEMLGGEDPALAGALGAAFAKGLQSFRTPSPAKGEELWMIATVAKHLAVSSGPEGDYGDRSDTMPGMVDARYNATTRIDERTWRDYYLPAWRAVTVDGGATGFMASYQALALSNTTPATTARLAALGIAPGAAVPDSSSALLLTDEVRGAWGTPGYVISDAGSVLCTATCRQSHNGGMRGHGFAANASDAAVRSLTAGVDLEISCCGLNATYPTLPASVRAGAVAEALLDRALARTLPWRFKTGTLNPPAGDPWAELGAADMATPAMRALSADAARQSITLLKNDGLLPLAPAALRTVAVIGPNGDDAGAMMGSYGYIPTDGSITTPFTALRAALPQAEVTLIADPMCPNVTNCDAYSASAVESASSADVVVAVLGASAALNGYTCAAGESYNEKEECDRRDPALPGAQLPLLQALAALGRPLVLVLVSGGALEVDWAVAAARVRAIVHVPYAGAAAGAALADALLGAASPAGRVAATWYTRAGLDAIGPVTEYRMRPDAASGYPGRTHLWLADPAKTLTAFPFGFGLSFASFAYSAAAAVPPNRLVTVTLRSQMTPDSRVTTTVSVTRSGSTHTF
jgi:beta-glucosidase-like glycosyl hydrolase